MFRVNFSLCFYFQCHIILKLYGEFRLIICICVRYYMQPNLLFTSTHLHPVWSQFSLLAKYRACMNRITSIGFQRILGSTYWKWYRNWQSIRKGANRILKTARHKLQYKITHSPAEYFDTKSFFQFFPIDISLFGSIL